MDVQVTDRPTEQARPTFDGAAFLDQSRFKSPAIARAFASALGAVAESAQSEMSGPAEVSLDPSASIS